MRKHNEYINSYHTAGDVTSGKSTTISGLAENTQFSFYVRAYDAAGNLSGLSNTVTPTTESPCVSSTICETSFEGTNGCWIYDNLGGGGGSDIGRTRSLACSFSAHNESEVIWIKYFGGIKTPSNDFSNNTSVDVSFYHTGYYQSGQWCGEISNTITLEVSTNGTSWTVLNSYNSNDTWQQATGTIDGAYMTSGVYIMVKAVHHLTNTLL